MASLELDYACLGTNVLLFKNAATDHHCLIQSEMEIQCNVLDRLWVLAQRYSILSRGRPTKLHLPSEASYQSEIEIKAEFISKLSLLKNSNSKLSGSLSSLRNTFSTLSHLLSEACYSNLSIANKEDSIQPNISSCVEIFEDFLKFFSKLQSNLNGFATLLTPDSVPSVERYKGLLKPNSDFDNYFFQCLATLYSFNNKTKPK